MSEAPITIAVLRDGLLTAGERVAAARGELCELDAIAGDGDLGVTLASGFGYVGAALRGTDGADLGTLFRETGVQLARNAPSTIGALLSGAFIRIAQQLDGVEELDGAHAAALLETAARSVAERGGARPGERTVLDAMDRAAIEGRAAAACDGGALAVLRQGAVGAVAGAAATAGMEPRHGRAGWIAERARGREDAGARAWAVFLGGLADGVADGSRTIGATTIETKEPQP